MDCYLPYDNIFLEKFYNVKLNFLFYNFNDFLNFFF